MRLVVQYDTRADLGVNPRSRLKSICTFQVGSDYFLYRQIEFAWRPLVLYQVDLLINLYSDIAISLYIYLPVYFAAEYFATV